MATYAEIGPHIYLGTEGGGIKVFADVAQDIRTLVNSAEDLEAVAYDSLNDRLYYSSYVTVYRTNPEGTAMEIVFNDNSLQCKSSPGGLSKIQRILPILFFIDGNIVGLAVDWITGNLYGASRGGYIFACNTNTTGPSSCITVLTSIEKFSNLALSPNDGYCA